MSIIRRPATLVFVLVAALFLLAACAPPESAEAPEAAEEATVEAAELTPAAATPITGDFETDTHKFEEVADGVYFVTYTVPMFNSNSMVVINEDDVLVVDSHITPTTGPAVDRLDPQGHRQADHDRRQHPFPLRPCARQPGLRPGADRRPRAHANADGGHAARGTHLGELHGWPAQWPGTPRGRTRRSRGRRGPCGTWRRGSSRSEGQIAANEEVVPTPPNTTFNERISLIRGDREIQVIFCGRAHTGGDVVIYLPADKIAFTGDMMLGGPSFLGDGHVDEWPETLENLKALDIELILPGHGPGITDLAIDRPRAGLLSRPLESSGGLEGRGQEHRRDRRRRRLERPHRELRSPGGHERPGRGADVLLARRTRRVSVVVRGRPRPHAGPVKVLRAGKPAHRTR